MKLVIALLIVCGSVWAQCSPSSIPFFDHFDSPTLEPCYYWVHGEPVGGWNTTANPSWLQINAPRPSWQEPGLFRSVPDVDMVIEAKMRATDGNPELSVWLGEGNVVNVSWAPSIQNIRAHSYFITGVNYVDFHVVAEFVWLRYIKTGSLYQVYCSTNGHDWSYITTWNRNMAVDGEIQVGIHAVGNSCEWDYFRVDGLDVLPVELLSFGAIAEDESVVLSWVTGAESEMSHFEIERDGAVVANVHATNRATGSRYQWRDEALENGREYFYTLTSVDLDGSREQVGQVSATPRANEVPSEFVLLQNYPNPFNAATTIEFVLPEISEISLSLHNLLGEEVATIAEGMMSAGVHRVNFDAGELSSGIYFYRLQAGAEVMQKKMAVVR